MYRDSLTAAVRRQTSSGYAITMALLLGLVFVASVASVELRFPGAPTAPWWPAAGLSVLAILASRGRGIAMAVLVLAVTTAANLVVGTVWWVAIGFGVANAAEAWTVAAVLRFRRRPGRRFRHLDSVRFLIATATGAMVIGVLVGAVVALDGGDAVAASLGVVASHGSSVLLIGVLGVLPRSSFRPRRPLELGVQTVALAIAVGLAFALPHGLPIAFLPFPVLAWAAFRFSAGITLAQVGLVSFAVTVLSFLGEGSFAAFAGDDAPLLVQLIQLLTLSLGASLLPLAVLEDDRADLLVKLSAREQLLRGAIVSSHAGFIVVRRQDDGVHRVVEANPNGERMLDAWLSRSGDTTTVDSGRVEALVRSGEEATTTSLELPGGVHLDVSASPVGDSDVLLIQAIDITERARSARALADAFVSEREAADRLRALSAQKDEFLSSVSHELRTPVTSILGYAEQLADAELPAGESRSVEVIMRNARRLAELVDDLLRASGQAGSPLAEPEPVEVRPAIARCVAALVAIAERAGVTVELAAGDEVVVSGDPLAVDRILANLLANAIKFTPPGGRIDISASVDGEGLARIEVADTGRGIPPDDLERVLDPFYRVTRDTGFVPGTGLGLPIAHDLATGMGGSIELRSDGTTGTTAIVHLPPHDKPSR